jgi:hypothetical protein
MPARRRAPTVTNWARELQNYGSGGGLEPSALVEILHKADQRLEEMWSYLRDVDATSAQNLSGFEAFLEVVYRLIKSAVPTGPSARVTVSEAANRTLTLIDATKTASRVLRRVAEVWQLSRRAAEKATAYTGADEMVLSRVGANEDELTMRHYAVINSIDSLREQMKVTAQLFQEEAIRSSGAGRRGSSPTDKPHQRRHHQPWSIAG